MDVEQAVIAAFEQLDVPVQAATDQEADQGLDLVVDPRGVGVGLELKRVALVTDRAVSRLRQSAQQIGSEESGSKVVMVVADQVTKSARNLLMDSGMAYLDLRGHIGLRHPRLIIDAEVEPQARRTSVVRPLAGRVGLEVAAALLMSPHSGSSVRQLARDLNRSASTVSQALAALRDDRLIDDQNMVSGPRLFWELADHWPGQEQYLAQLPPPGAAATITIPLRLGLDDLQNAGWALRGSAAAVALGAPIAVRADQPLDFFVPDRAIVHRATRLLGGANFPDSARCSVTAAPVPAACLYRRDPPENHFGWPTTHPLFVALDLAQDAGRGREVLADWSPSGDWDRVW